MIDAALAAGMAVKVNSVALAHDNLGEVVALAEWAHARGAAISFITPLSNNFCDSCNRVRVTCTGQLYLCLGQDARVDLRAILRSTDDDAPLEAAIARAMRRKPRAHDFMIAAAATHGVARRSTRSII